MKPNRYFAITLLCALFIGCNQQPIGKSLLSGAKSDTIEDLTSAPNDGDLEIQPDNTAISVNVDDSDKVEITGTCKDLDRKNNRILVEVFAGENENTLSPYISNASSDKCLTIDAGISTLDKCFWVTKGVGLKEEVGLPTEKSFPQCHNGRFGFSVKLGAVLVNPAPGQTPLKYLIRFKLRTLDGLLADTAFSKVTVSRDLVTPVISASFTSSLDFGCKVTTTNAARFNLDIQYNKLERKNVDTVCSPSPCSPQTFTHQLFGNDKDTSNTLPGDSVFEWLDFNDLPLLPLPAPQPFHASSADLSPGVISGMTYTYTLTATASGDFTYGIPPLNGPAPSKTSTTASCEVPRPALQSLPASPSLAPFPPGTWKCWMSIQSPNPGISIGLVTTEWGYSESSNWIGANADANSGFTPIITCTGEDACNPDGLAAGKSYFFAVREINQNPLDGSKGKWSPVAECRTQ